MPDHRFIVAFKNASGQYDHFVTSFFVRKGKEYLRQTRDITAAQRYCYQDAEEIVNKLDSYCCVGRIEKISEENNRETLLTLL